MADMLSPLTWTTATDSGGDESADTAAKLGREAFQWPTPPYAIYPAPMSLTQPVACQVIGVNDKRMVGRLTFFVPDEGVAHVQLPPARTTLPLRFDQFRSLTLMNALKPVTPSESDSQFAALSQPEASTYQITLKTGGQLVGPTVGHVETEFGLFLFPPQGESGAVTRMFIPRQAWASFEIGPRIDELLLAQRRVTPQQVRQAVDTQDKLRQQKLGDILVMRQVVSSDQLLAAIERQSKMPLVRIGEALISLRMVNERQLKEALEQQKSDRSVPLGELLVRMGVVSADDLRTALARKMGYPIVNLDLFPIEADALRRLSYSVALRLQVMPLLVREGRLVVAMNDPARRRAAVEEVEFNAQMKVVAVLANIESLDAALHAAYERIGGASSQRPTPGSGIVDNEIATEKLVETLEKEGNLAEDDKPIEQSDNSLVRLINNMVIEAHRDGVSDIHIESYPGREKIRIRFRKDGLLRTYLELPPNYRNALIARIKIMCDLDISERRKPQDGKINFSKFSAPHKLELRVATIPTNSSLEDVVIRILASAKPMPMDRLDLSEANLARLQYAIERPYGMVLCVGPTGSGKTTTLHSALSHINVPERKIWTAEDPIEITQPGLRQVQVNPKIDWTFAKALRAFLRADPDVVMVGEIRDSETAQVAIEASLTGHLVMSTLHTNSAPETVTRLLDMGMDPFNFADSLLAVLAQRLVRRLCTACRRSTPATKTHVDEMLADYMHAFGAADKAPVAPDAVLAGWKQRNSRDGRLLAHHSPGCIACDHTGFKGRAGMHELMVISRDLRQLIQTGSRAALLQQVALAEGMRTLRQDGIEKVLAGVTTMEEVRAMSNV